MALGYVYIQEIGRESERLGKRGWKLRICLGRRVVLLEYAGTVDRDMGEHFGTVGAVLKCVWSAAAVWLCEVKCYIRKPQQHHQICKWEC
jgi:hypothetical protein